MNASIALIGDYNKSVIAHTAILRSLDLLRDTLGIPVTWEWIETSAIQNPSRELSKFSGIWVVPASPYANMEAVLNTIKFAREARRPFLGTCGGCQHALIEYARNVCNINDADHGETNPNGENLIVTPLTCSLVEKKDQVVFTPGSRLFTIFNKQPTTEGYHCSYGLNPEWRDRLEDGGIEFTGFDADRDMRAFELPGHPFFIGTLFQPERSALRNEIHPLILAFVEEAAAISKELYSTHSLKMPFTKRPS